MNQQHENNQLMLLIEWLYNRCLKGGYGLDSAYELAQHYRLGYTNEHSSIKSLIRQESIKAGTSGFISGLGGVLALPVALPANAISVLFLQMRLTMTIALIRGHDVQTGNVKKLVYLSLCGQSLKTLLKEHCALLLNHSSNTILNIISQQIWLNVAKQQGVKNVLKLCRYLPLLGGVIGGTCDSWTTYYIGQLAESQFKNC